jgi:hypothetical protein
MSIFAIISQSGGQPAQLESAIAQAYKDDFLAIGPGNWLIASEGTAKEVSDKLGISTGKVGSALVIEFAAYYGRANTNIWAWIKNKWEAKSG